MYCQTKSKQIEFENYFVQKKLKGFNPKTCQAWRKLTERFGPKISHEEILSLAMVIADNMHISLSREYKRRKNMLVKWFDENLNEVWPLVETCIIVKDKHGDIVDYSKSI